MANANTTDATASDLHKLRDTVLSIDSLSQNGFSEIATIAKLALARLETPDGYRHLEDPAYALRAIWGNAENTENCINSAAVDIGCNYVDDAQRRRYEARIAHHKQEAAHT